MANQKLVEPFLRLKSKASATTTNCNLKHVNCNEKKSRVNIFFCTKNVHHTSDIFLSVYGRIKGRKKLKNLLCGQNYYNISLSSSKNMQHFCAPHLQPAVVKLLVLHASCEENYGIFFMMHTYIFLHRIRSHI